MEITPVENYEYLKGILEKLKVPMPYKWRVQSFSKSGNPQATCVAYIDSRDVMDRLDSVCEYGWQRQHTSIKDNIYCSVGINMPDGSVMWRQDCGTESSTEKEKGESSDSFKRAAVNWGVGRFLYDFDVIRLKSNELKTGNNYPHVVDDAGRKVWNLNEHIQKLKPQNVPTNQATDDADDLWNKALEAVKTAESLPLLESHYKAALSLVSKPAEKTLLNSATATRKNELSV